MQIAAVSKYLRKSIFAVLKHYKDRTKLCVLLGEVENPH